MGLHSYLTRKRSELAGLLETRKDVLKELETARAAADPARIDAANAKLEHISGRITEAAEAINYLKEQEV